MSTKTRIGGKKHVKINAPICALLSVVQICYVRYESKTAIECNIALSFQS